MSRLEGAPTDEQKNRLEDWLTELRLICRKYRFHLDTEDVDTRVIDMDSNTIVGIGVATLIAERGGRRRISAIDLNDSILDGVWPVDTPDGPVDQHRVGRTWPAHPEES